MMRPAISQRTPTSLLVSALVLGSLASPSGARRRSHSSFQSSKAGIRMFMPAQWRRQERSSFPGVLATFKHHLGGRCVLAVRKRPPTEAATDAAEKNRKQLAGLGWRTTPRKVTRMGRLEAASFTATDAKGVSEMQQVYAVKGSYLYVLTLVSPLVNARRLRADFLFVLRSVRFKR